MTLDSNSLFAEVYNQPFKDIISHVKERFTFPGGRASCKSSFISIVIVVLIVMFPGYNALIVRRYSKSLRRSVFEQIKWAIEALHLKGFSISNSNTAALPITYRRKNGKTQQIIFAGCDDPEKIKSIKIANGYIAILWVEEKTELNEGYLHNVRISALRGGNKFYIFESFNPPASNRNWCNRELTEFDPNRMIIRTTYMDIPKSWLGEALLHDIEQTKRTNKRAYDNIYLGIATGTGQNIFENVTLRKIKEEEIESFDFIYCGLDWGYYPDPLAFSVMSYDSKTQTLYIFDELYLYKHGNFEAFNAVREHMEEIGMSISQDRITADSAEPKSIGDFKDWGANIRGAIKGVGSRDASFKWLQGLKQIVIDPIRCPKIADEFSLYEHEIDQKTGEIMSGYPDGQPDHGIDSVRYAMQPIWKHKGE